MITIQETRTVTYEELIGKKQFLTQELAEFRTTIENAALHIKKMEEKIKKLESLIKANKPLDPAPNLPI